MKTSFTVASTFVVVALLLFIITMLSSSNSNNNNEVFVSAAIIATPSSTTCHNATGSCTKTHFVCANEEVIPHSKRCDGVEDCADGTDEYMCDQSSHPIAQRSFAERAAITEVSCIKCTCLKGTVTVASGNAAWWNIATSAPRDNTMLTSAPHKQNRPCNPAATAEIVLNVYKKQNKGCRGFVCCFRQEECKSCNSYLKADNCWP